MTPILADAGEITLRDVAFIVGLFATCASVAAIIARPIYGRARKVDEGIEAAKRVEAAVFPSNDLSLPERVREISQRQQELGTHFDMRHLAPATNTAGGRPGNPTRWFYD